VHGSALNPGSFAVPNVFHIPMGELIERAARPSDVVMDKLKAVRTAPAVFRLLCLTFMQGQCASVCQASLVFLVCNTGVRAVSAAELVRVSGITTAQAVEGGITAWNAAIASCSSRA
jgi:rhodanese-related sulfurtransferase